MSVSCVGAGCRCLVYLCIVLQHHDDGALVIVDKSACMIDCKKRDSFKQASWHELATKSKHMSMHSCWCTQ